MHAHSKKTSGLLLCQWVLIFLYIFFRCWLQGVVLSAMKCLAPSLPHITHCVTEVCCVWLTCLLAEGKMDKLICCGAAKIKYSLGFARCNFYHSGGWVWHSFHDLKGHGKYTELSAFLLNPRCYKDASTCCFMQPGFKLFLSASLSKNNQSNRTS